MPYKNVAPADTAKVDACVAKLVKSGKDKSSAYAICVSQFQHESAAVVTTKSFNDYPDSSFAYVAPGGKKDSEGKTVPRSLRKLPYKSSSGTIDAAHTRNALARLSQSDIPEAKQSAIRTKLENALKKANASVSAIASLQVNVDVPVLGPQRIFKVGDYSDSEQFPGFICTDEWLAKLKENFDNKVFYPVAVNVDHNHTAQGSAAAGWIVSLTLVPSDGLYMTYCLTAMGEKLVDDGIYKGFSPEWDWEFKDEFGDEQGQTLRAVSLTNQRYFQQSVPAMASSTSVSTRGKLYSPIKIPLGVGLTNLSPMARKKATAAVEMEEEAKKVEAPAPEKKSGVAVKMDLATVLAKDPADLTEAEAEFLGDHWDALSAEDQAKFKEAVDAVMNAPEEKKEEMTPAMADEEKAPVVVDVPPVTPPAPPVEKPVPATAAVDKSATAKGILIDAKELASLRLAAAEAAKAKDEALTLKTQAEVKSRWLATSADGKFAPAAEASLVRLLKKANKADRADLEVLLKSSAKAAIMGEIGTADSFTPTNASEVATLVKARVAEAAKAGKRMTAAMAYNQIAREQPELLKKAK